MKSVRRGLIIGIAVFGFFAQDGDAWGAGKPGALGQRLPAGKPITYFGLKVEKNHRGYPTIGLGGHIYYGVESKRAAAVLGSEVNPKDLRFYRSAVLPPAGKRDNGLRAYALKAEETARPFLDKEIKKFKNMWGHDRMPSGSGFILGKDDTVLGYFVVAHLKSMIIGGDPSKGKKISR